MVYGLDASNLNSESKNASSNLGTTIFSKPFDHCCRLDLTHLVREETIQWKKTTKNPNNKQTVIITNREKIHQQRQLIQSKHPYDLSRFYGVVVSTLEFEYKDPSSTLGRTFSQLIFDDVDYSRQ